MQFQFNNCSVRSVVCGLDYWRSQILFKIRTRTASLPQHSEHLCDKPFQLAPWLFPRSTVTVGLMLVHLESQVKKMWRYIHQ